MGFNEWLLENYGITADDMTDEDYDDWYEYYQRSVINRYEDWCAVDEADRQYREEDLAREVAFAEVYD